MYKLTNGPISRIRQTKEECRALIAKGYKLDGEVNKDYEIINPYPDIAGDPLAELRTKLVLLGCPQSTAERFKNEKTLLKKIEEYNEEK